jgi:23S rRNA pseudouridine2604 synthase
MNAEQLPTEGAERLSKRVARTLNCSRSDAERHIESGAVRINGAVVTTPMTRVQDEHLDIEPLRAQALTAPVTVLLHKVAGQISPAEHRSGQSGFLDAEQQMARPGRLSWSRGALPRLQRCIDLEQAASGLVVFSQDSGVLRRLQLEGPTLEHELLLSVRGPVSPEQLQTLNTPVRDARGAWPAVRISLNSQSGPLTRLRVVLKGEHLGLMAALCARAGLDIAELKQIRLGRVALGKLAPGCWRLLQMGERF